MLKFILMATASALAISGAAIAADAPLRAAPAPAPISMYEPKPAFSWTGAYAGVYVGGGVSSSTSKVAYPGLPGGGNIEGLLGSSILNSSNLEGLYPGVVNINPQTLLRELDGAYPSLGSLMAPKFGPGQTNVLTSPTYLVGGAAMLVLPAVFNGDVTNVNRGVVSFPTAPGKLGGSDPVLGGGAEVGYNHQIGFTVIGAAADFTWLGKAKASNWSSTGGFYGTADEPNCASGDGSSTLCSYGISGAATSAGSVQASAQWISTLRLKAGVAMDRVLVYGTGGFAFGKVTMSSQSSWTDSVTATCTSSGDTNGGGCEIPVAVGFGSTAAWQGSMSKTRTGYTVGGGLEYAVTDNWMLKLEGLYYNLGTARMSVNGVGAAYISYPTLIVSPTVAVAPYTVEKEIRGVIGKFGMSYKFATN